MTESEEKERGAAIHQERDEDAGAAPSVAQAPGANGNAEGATGRGEKERARRAARMRFSKKRGIVVGVVFLSVLVGLVVHTATGTESALGWRDIAAICPVGALEALAGSRGLALHAVLLLAAALLIAALFGKSFCAWLCPTPYVRKIFGVGRGGKGSSKSSEGSTAGEPCAGAVGLGDGGRVPVAGGAPLATADSPAAASCVDAAKEPVPGTVCGEDAGSAALPLVGGERDGFHLDSRHLVLAGAVGSSFVFGFPVFCLVCPVGITFAIVIGVFNLVRFADTSWGLVAFPLLLVLELVVFRRWCTNLCPISALLSLVSARTRRVGPRVDRSRCLRAKGTDCRVCVEECPERVDPHVAGIPECSSCGACADKCPAQAIAIKLGKWEQDR